MVTRTPVVLRRHQGRLRTSPLDHTGVPSNLVLERWQAVLLLYYAGYVHIFIYASPSFKVGTLESIPQDIDVSTSSPPEQALYAGMLAKGGALQPRGA